MVPQAPVRCKQLPSAVQVLCLEGNALDRRYVLVKKIVLALFNCWELTLFSLKHVWATLKQSLVTGRVGLFRHTSVKAEQTSDDL